MRAWFKPGHLRMLMASISSLASLPHALAVGPCAALGVVAAARCPVDLVVSSVSAWSVPKACEPVDPDFVNLLTRYSRPCPIGPRDGPPETRFPRCSTRSRARNLAGVRKRPDALLAGTPARRSATASDRERKIAARSRARSSVPARDARRASKGPTLTEIPEHLLKRSRERRAALGLPTDGGEGTPPEGGAAEGSASVPAAVTPSSPAPRAGRGRAGRSGQAGHPAGGTAAAGPIRPTSPRPRPARRSRGGPCPSSACCRSGCCSTRGP